MRGAAHHHDLLYGEGEVDGHTLEGRTRPDGPRRGGGHGANVLAFEAHHAGCRASWPLMVRSRVDLPAPLGPSRRDHVSVEEGQTDGVQRGARAVADGDVEQIDHAVRRRRRSRTKKKGAPSRAVITPTGISTSGTSVRHTVSARSRRDALHSPRRPG